MVYGTSTHEHVHLLYDGQQVRFVNSQKIAFAFLATIDLKRLTGQVKIFSF